MSGFEILAVIGIIGFFIYQQLAGQFAPEKDGGTFLADAFSGHDRDMAGRY